ncbi:MAG: hypothetical protein D6E12_15020 [Desulfovibrio sp.]|nr:MAG: hypothetical protein D6E12_15020 [Desulfovibrio sp.]
MPEPHPAHETRPLYMRWFFPVSLGFFLTLVLALLILYYVPGLWPLTAHGPSEEDQLLLAARHREADLRTELAQLQETYLALAMECRAVAQAEEARRLAQLEEERRLQEELLQEQLLEEELDELAENIPEDMVPEDVPQDDLVEEEPMEDELIIPEDAEETGDMEFLEGCWLSETGLVNMDTGEPVTVKYCFDANGQGTREIQDMRGMCSGPASASMAPDGSLNIQARQSPCNFGDVAYIESTVDCRGDQDRRAVCHGQEGGVRWNAHFMRIR